MYANTTQIRRQFRVTLLALIAALLICANSAKAQFVINFDENGGGTLQTSTGQVQPIQSLGNIQDPFDPTSGLMPLGYNLIGTIPGVAATDGDILLLEPGNPAATVSDLLRFTHGLLLVYSDLPEPGETPDLADVGIPQSRQQNLISMFETGPEGGVNGMFGYVPVAGGPGFYPIPPGPANYNFFSDVPEPTTVGAIAMVGVAMLMRRPRR